MEHGDDGDWILFWSVRKDVFPHDVKAQRAVGQIGAGMTHEWKWRQGLNGLIDFLDDPIGGVEAVARDVLPDFV